jgi:colanic acid/amylovoran biosynthesis glycosyltransferase
MRIGIVLPSVPSYSETFFRSKIAGLLESGFEVTLFVKNGKNSKNFICPVKVHPRISSVLVLRLIQSLFWLFYVALLAPKPSWRLWLLCRRHGFTPTNSLQSMIISATILPENLHWIHFGFATMAIDREFLAAAIGAKMAVSLRGYDISIYPLKHKGCYALLWRQVDKVHTISNDLLDVAYRFGLPKGVAVQKITPAIQVKSFANQDIKKIEREELSILTVARLHWKKGLEYTLQALSYLKQKGIVFTYKIAGDGREFERLKFAVHQLDLADEVEFLGKVTHEEVIRLMHKSDIYIQYSIQEGFCNSVLEAQAAGMLCVVSDAEGLSENVLHEQTGWVVPKRNPKALAQKLQEILNMPDDKKELIRQQACERVFHEFRLEKQVKSFVEFYKKD